MILAPHGLKQDAFKKCRSASAEHLDDLDFAAADTGLSHDTELRPMQLATFTSTHQTTVGSLPSAEPIFWAVGTTS
jgi:hypothetical protein